MKSAKIFLVAATVLMGAGLAADAYAQVPDEVKIAVVLPLTGELSSFGIQLNQAAELAVADFNAYLEENGQTWRLALVAEDTETNPVRALEKIQALHARGIDIIVGPAGSAQLSSILPYMNDNNMIAISPSSTAPALAIPGDSAFRTVPDDFNQGRAIGALLEHEGIEAVVPIWRGEVYGDGLVQATVDDFESRGGAVYDGVRYNPESSEFSVSVAELADGVSEALETHDADKTAVLIVAFDEAVPIFQVAATYDMLDDIRWFGGEAVAQSTVIAEDAIASQFAIDTDLVTVQLLLDPGDRADSISERIGEWLGDEPTAFVYTSYDAVWLAGLGILETGSTDPADIRDAMLDVAASYSGGALSSTEMNEAGDLMLANYETWLLVEDGWIRGVAYDGQSDSIMSVGVVDGTGFAPDHDMQGGSVLGMYTDPQEATLIIDIDAVEDGMLEITLPRDLVDSQTPDGDDSGFFVLVDGEEAVHEETAADGDSRTLAVEFLAGAEKIEVIGTSAAIPEFGEIGMLVLAAGLVLITVVSYRYRTRAARVRFSAPSECIWWHADHLVSARPI